VGYPASSSLPDDGAIVGRVLANSYLIEAPCERTPHVSIYRAQHLTSDRTVLLRVLPGRAGLTRQSCRGALSLAERAAALSSPHVARTLDVGAIAERWPFVVSEHSKGRTLAALVAGEGALGTRRALAIGRQIASALALAHLARLAHGQLRLDGIWTESPGGRPEWVRLMDFGVSELSQRGFEQCGSGVFPSAAAAHASPDDGFSRLAEQADLQAFGALLYELTTGTVASPATVDVRASLDIACAGSRATRGLTLLVERCLGLVPGPRYASMSQLLDELEAVADAACRDPQAPTAPVTAVHAPPRRASVALGGPKVIVRG
jgi:eukaryotic-like serine/threonine-protein kinase